MGRKSNSISRRKNPVRDEFRVGNRHRSTRDFPIASRPPRNSTLSSTSTVPPVATLDHLVVAATTLADGIEYIAETTGATPQPGGKHLAWGTHNALMRLGENAYLEIIAIDPGGTKPARPRWYDLDNIALQAEITERPRLIHWVAQTTDIEAAAARCSISLGPVHTVTRASLRWRITIPDDGKLPGKGVVPSLIQWDVPVSPAGLLPKSNVSIMGLAASHPDPAAIRGALASLGLEGAIPVTYDRDTRLAAMLRTPRGIVTL